MTDEVEERIVFLDTEVFDRLHHQYQHPNLRRLVSLVQNQRIKVISTSVTNQEIHEHITTWFLLAIKALTRTVQSHPILRNFRRLGLYDAISDDTRQQMEKDLQENFMRFKVDADVEVLSIEDVNPEKTFEAYFKKAPPFGEGKKKSEFPDAFAAAALKKWCEDKGKPIYVVSNDSDWKAICEASDRMAYFPDLVSFLEVFPDERTVLAIKQGIEKQCDVLTEQISTAFYDLSFLVDSVEGEVDEVFDVEVQVESIHITEAAAGKAIVEVSTSSDFQASAWYMVPGTGTWDSEDKVLFNQKNETGVVSATETRPVRVFLTYDESDPSKIEIKHIDIDYSEPVWVDVYDMEL